MESLHKHTQTHIIRNKLLIKYCVIKQKRESNNKKRKKNQKQNLQTCTHKHALSIQSPTSAVNRQNFVLIRLQSKHYLTKNTMTTFFGCCCCSSSIHCYRLPNFIRRLLFFRFQLCVFFLLLLFLSKRLQTFPLKFILVRIYINADHYCVA